MRVITGTEAQQILFEAGPRPESTNPKDIAAHDRVNMALLPPVSQIAVARVLEHGAEKYGPYNWRSTKVGALTYVAAIQRHLAAWVDGEDLDPESRLPHIAHIAAGCAILLDAAATGNLIDDRPPAGPAGDYVKAIASGKNPFHNHGPTVEDPLPPAGSV